MKVEEIRKLFNKETMADAAEQEPKIVAVLQLVALGEIAAQLAELNDRDQVRSMLGGMA